MSFHRAHTPGTRYMRGAALTEFAIIVPLFLMIMIAVVDVGRVLTQYFGVVRAAREAAHLGIRTIGLETTVVGADDVPCRTEEGVPVDCGHASSHLPMHRRADLLLSLRGYDNARRFASSYDDTQGIVRFDVEYQYQPLLSSALNPLTIDVEVVAPFLID